MGAAAGSSDESDGGARVVLAHTAQLRIGPLAIEPARLRVAHDDGREEFLQPRVMQVLVALARAGGAILSRDDLTERCWEGRIVGDDAINRVLAQLRRLAEGIGAGAFTVETIPRVGYRLVRGAEGGTAEEPAPAPAPPRARRWPADPRLLVAGAAALLVLAAALIVWSPWRAASAVPAVAVLNATQGPEAQALARDLGTDLARLAGAQAGDLAVLDGARAADADYLIRIAGARQGANLHAELTLSSRAGELLWSAAFDRPAADQADMRQQVAIKLGDVLLCALHGDGGGGVRLDTVTLRLFLNYCDRNHDAISMGELEMIRQVTTRAPGFARGWASRALTEASLGGNGERRGPLDDQDRVALRAAAREHLLKARAMDPSLGETYLAEIFLQGGTTAWAERLALFDRGIAASSYAPLYDYRSVELMRVGRMSDAVESARRAVSLDPLSPWHLNALVSALAYSGDTGAARKELERGERIWPGSEAMRDLRYRFDLRFGDARHALAMLDDPVNAETVGPAEARAAFRAFIEARIDPSPAKVDAAVRAATVRPEAPRATSAAYLQALGYFGRVDEAYRAIGTPEIDELWTYGTEILFRPGMKAILHDRRFMPLARRLGLVRYWQASGKWPDFCSDPDLPYDCRAEAGKVGA